MISFELVGATTSYLALSGDEPATPSVLHEFTALLADEGVYPPTVRASLNRWWEATRPTEHLDCSFALTLEPKYLITCF